MNPLLLTDGYKTGHHQQYPKGTTLVYSNFTPRSNKYAPKGCDQVVSFGQQMVMQQIHEAFQKEFFNRPKEEVCGEMKEELSMYLNTDYDVSHFEALHDLGYLPIAVKALPEGTLVPIKVPVLTIYNTHPDFYWVTNYLETILSNLLWKPMTSATIAHQYRKVLTKWMEKTDSERAWFIDWQGHDFSMRGMDSVEAVISSGVAHLTSFMGSDSLPAIHGARKYYGAEGAVCGSVNATEHSVMCAGGKEDEVETFRRLLETYPTGILSVVSDTWDLWKVCTEHVVTLKDEIMNRDGKLVIRPDSGNPVDILCGECKVGKLNFDQSGRAYPDNPKIKENWALCYIHDNKYYKLVGDDEHKEWDEITPEPKHKGVIELLWDVFGGTINEQGYKVLDPHIGAIYGDSITIDRADEICARLEAKGFASTNVVLGIGSFTYQYNTRDTFGFAMKATYVEIKRWDVATERLNEAFGKNANPEWIEGREIFKDPITDDGTKKSATGLLSVHDHDGEYVLIDRCTWAGEETGCLQTIYKNGQFENIIDLETIRKRLK
jgi:nicotinamide phosphoribosyltransferase